MAVTQPLLSRRGADGTAAVRSRRPHGTSSMTLFYISLPESALLSQPTQPVAVQRARRPAQHAPGHARKALYDCAGLGKATQPACKQARCRTAPPRRRALENCLGACWARITTEGVEAAVC